MIYDQTNHPFGNQTHEGYIYVGQYHYEYAPVKIGRTTNFNALFRGRNQGGANFRIFKVWKVKSSWAAEKTIKHALVDDKISLAGTNSIELYNPAKGIEYYITAIEKLL